MLLRGPAKNRTISLLMMSNELSAYELKRLENIRQNQKILEALEIPKVIPQEKPAAVNNEPAKKSKILPMKNSNPKPTRISARIKAKIEEETTGRRRSKHLLTELPEPVPKIVKPRPLPGSRVPFEPEEGVTDSFIQMMTKASIKSETNIASCLSNPPKIGIKNQSCVTKVLQDRIYSVALHPSTEKIIAATGSKSGQLAFWDATSLYYETTNDDRPSRYYRFQPHSGAISTLRYNPVNSSQLLSSGYEGSIQCMDIITGCFETVYVTSTTEQYISTFDFFNGSGGNVIGFSDMSGFVSILDCRSRRKPNVFGLHEKKIGGFSISPVNSDYLATSSLDDTVCIWDRRSLKPEDSIPVARFEYKRAVTAVNFHPTIPDCLVSTCYDDSVRIHRSVLSDRPKELTVRHNNQTGRWITTFKAYWDPKSTDDLGYVVLGDMNRGLDLIDGTSGVTHNFTSDYLTAQPAVNASHSILDLIVSGNASGKLALWTLF